MHNVKGFKSQTLRRNDPLYKFCGLRHSFSHPSKCPALKQECRKCKKVGHFARMFKSSPVSTSNVQPVEGGDVYEDDCNDNIHAYFASVELGSVDTSVSRKKSTINVMISNHNVKVKADTGAEANVIPYNLYHKLSRKPLQKIYQPLKAWLATKPIHPLGCVSGFPHNTEIVKLTCCT